MKVKQLNKVQNSQVEVNPPLKKSILSILTKTVLSMVTLLSIFPAYATTPAPTAPAAPAQDIATTIQGWQATIKTSLDAAVLVFAIVGSFLIFMQYMQGNEQAQKNLIRFVIGLGIFGIAELVSAVFIT